MSFTIKVAAVLGAFASAVSGHGTITGFLTDTTYNQGYLLEYYYMLQNGQTPPLHYGWYAEDLDNGFVSPDNYTGSDIICHKNAKPANATAKIAAGGKVSFEWTVWPSSHIGPVITYVAKCDADCADADKTTLKWVKIDEAGYNTDTKSWAAIDMIANNNTWVSTVPSTLAAGNYVFRNEIIALHGAESENGAQNYPQCMNIEITGDGTDNPEGTLGTELYTPTDPGILFNPYTTITSYTIPGPALYGSGSTQPSAKPASSAAASSTPAASATPTPSPTPTTLATSVAVAVTSAPAADVTLYSTAVETQYATTYVEVDPSATAAPIATPTPSSGSDETLPKEFTLDTFISWLKEQGTSSGVLRRHARAF